MKRPCLLFTDTKQDVEEGMYGTARYVARGNILYTTSIVQHMINNVSIVQHTYGPAYD